MSFFSFFLSFFDVFFFIYLVVGFGEDEEMVDFHLYLRLRLRFASGVVANV